MQLNTAFEELSSLMNYIDLGFDLEGSIGVLQLLIIAPSVLIAVGIWMLYADARQPADQPIKTTAIGLIRGDDNRIYGGVPLHYCAGCTRLLFCNG